ncbi:MAG: ABC transporter permease [Acidobacteriaceae bacterium]
MNMQSNALPQASLEAQAIAPAVIPPTRRMYWSVRRELWENRSIYLAPLAVAALVLIGFLISALRPSARMQFELALHQGREAIALQPYDVAALLIMATTFIVAVFYCLDALYGERRDRSILFWKSLPVSDLTTVLAKASIPLVVLPLLTFAITVATQSIMLLLNAAVLLGSGVSVTTLWTHVPLVQMWLMLLYHLVAIHALWYAPIYGWLLLVSAWARRAPFLWATLPLLAIGVVEKIAFNTSHFAAMLKSRLGGGKEGAAFTPTMNMNLMTHLNPGQFLTSPGLWIGLAVAAAFLAAAVRLRRDRGPI